MKPTAEYQGSVPGRDKQQFQGVAVWERAGGGGAGREGALAVMFAIFVTFDVFQIKQEI